MFANLVTDSFPALWVTVLRLWSMIGFGAGDDWLRALGIIITAGLLAALWRNARLFGCRVPLLSCALIAFNPTVFYWGDSLRAYGLALLLIVLLFGAIWKLTKKLDAASAAGATLLAVLSAQSNYQNSYLVFGVCVAGAAVCFLQKMPGRASFILGIGFVAALSLLPYLPVIKTYTSASVIMGSASDTGWVFSQIADAFGAGMKAMLLIWALLAIALACLPFWAGRWRREAFIPALFCAVAVFSAAVAMAGFIRFVGMPTVNWYYIPFLGFAAVAMESAFAPLLAGKLARQLRLCVSAGIIALCIGPLWQAAGLRRTSMDMVAGAVSKEAGKDDYVLLAPFYQGISFDYYYRGKAPWCYIPVVTPEKRDRYFLTIKEEMASASALDMTLAKIEEVLRAGGRVWWAGVFIMPEDGVEPPVLPPAPHSKHGWDAAPYRFSWELRAGDFIRRHAAKIDVRVFDSDQPVNKLENAMLVSASGWKE
jgi:hypothetical protein